MFGNTTQMLSKTVKGLITNPYKLETTLGVVRSLAPLTSPQAVSKFNIFLPMIEKFSSIIGMYSFINKAQNYAPIQSLQNKPPMEKVAALFMNNNNTLGKTIASPIISSGIEKVIGQAVQTAVTNSIKNGSFEKMVASMMSNMTSQSVSNQSNENSNVNAQNTNNSSNNGDNTIRNQNTSQTDQNTNSTESNSQIDFAKIFEILGPLLNNK